MIFVSISNSDIEICLQLVEKYKNIELRLDLIRPDFDELAMLLSKSVTSICSYRSSFEPERSLEYALKSIDYGADITDIGLDMPAENIKHVVSYAKNKEKKIMLSYHNYNTTPENEYLEGLINEAEEYHPDLIKIACRVQTETDSGRLLCLMQRSENIIPVPMGEAGQKGRLRAYFYGCPIVFSYPDEEKPTAPGQLPFSDFKDMDKIISIIYR